MDNSNNQEQTQGKTLIVNHLNHKTLSMMKIEGDFKSIDDLVSRLIESHNKLKVMEINEQTKKEKKNGRKK